MWIQKTQMCDNFITCNEESIIYMLKRIYLCSGEYKLDGFEHLDINPPSWGVKWQWGEKLPYKDREVMICLVQHGFMYTDNYDDALKEIRRVLS